MNIGYYSNTTLIHYFMKELKISLIIIASVIGAGFASGKEIFEYFAKYGVCSLLYLLPLFSCVFIFTKTLLNFGSRNVCVEISECNKFLCKDINIFKKKINPLNVIMFCTFLILSSAMFSGLYALLKTYIPFGNSFIIFIIVFIFSWLIIKLPFKALSNISYMLMPAIIALIIICAISSFKATNYTANFGEINIISLALKTPLYASGNLFLTSFMVINFGKKLTTKQQNKVSLFVAIILCSLLCLGILCFVFNPKIAFSDMPFAEISFQISPIFSIVFGVIIFLAITTTYATTTSSLKQYFNGKKKYNNHFFMLMIIALVSLIDFGTIIEFLYPVIGMFGMCYLFLCEKQIANN